MAHPRLLWERLPPPPLPEGLSALSQGQKVDEATDDKYVQPGETETVEECLVLTNDDV